MTADLRALADQLRPELAAEIDRLYAIKSAHTATLEHLDDTARRLHTSTTMVGHLRERLVRAERRLEDVNVEEISKARHAALFLGAGYLRITSTGRGRFTTEHVASERVTIHGH